MKRFPEVPKCSVLGRTIGFHPFKAFHHQDIGQQPMLDGIAFQGSGIRLSTCENSHAFVIGKLPKSLATHAIARHGF
ncbi:hypothetical protein A6A04_20700 [Paramagnetospirillum marisnigri]|uniref:Uncharacterized protein n=2 Tax=Paramagnetospirillum marisnigri TaxID=1285242 RepID=A0A178ME00_9PROT|nr:hypothetical protein A6A04_20700 [Paramagnetospirillum marisnigri]